MMEAVHRYESTVNQVMGDGIMALFGAPLAHEDHAVRACYAALAMQQAIRRYTAEVRRDHGVEVQIRVGLNSGEVVVRAIGSDLRMDYSAVGQTTQIAARIGQLATPGSTRLTAETLRLAEGFVEVVPVGPIPVKGLASPVDVFELGGPSATRTRLQAAAARGLTRFVGRGQELDHLRQALDKARGAQGQVVAVVGEAGVGKSRLLWEFIHSHRTQGWLVLESSSVSYGKASAYLPVIDLCRSYFRIEARDDARSIREKVTGKLLTLDESLRAMVPGFLSLLDVPTDDASWDALDPRQRRRRTVNGLRRMLLRESQTQPVCLVFEDLQWVDAETQGLLDALVESLSTARILLLVNYRPEYGHGWGNKTYYNQLRLDPLPIESAEEVLRALLGEAEELDPLKHLLVERAEGVPLFLEESVRTLVESEAITGDRGAYRLARPFDTIRVQARHRALHARIVKVSEALYPERTTERSSWLTLHALRGEVWDRAVAYLRGTESPTWDGYSSGFGALESAGALWWMGDHEHVITTAQRELGAAPAMAAWGFGLAIASNLRIGQAYHSLGEYSRAMDSLRKNIEMLRGGSADDRIEMMGLPSVLSRAWLALCLAELGDFDEGLAAAEEALRVAEASDPGYSLVVASGGLGSACLLKGDLDRAVTILERGLPREPAEPINRAWPFVASALGAAYTYAGRVDDALPLLEQAVERAAAMKLRANQSLRLARLAEAHVRVGRPESAFPVAVQALDLAQEHRERGHEAHIVRLLAAIEMEREAPTLDRAEEGYRKALTLAEQLGMRPLQAHCHLGLGRLYQRRGDGEAAAAVATARDLFRSMGMTFWLRDAE